MLRFQLQVLAAVIGVWASNFQVYSFMVTVSYYFSISRVVFFIVRFLTLSLGRYDSLRFLS